MASKCLKPDAGLHHIPHRRFHLHRLASVVTLWVWPIQAIYPLPISFTRSLWIYVNIKPCDLNIYVYVRGSIKCVDGPLRMVAVWIGTKLGHFLQLRWLGKFPNYPEFTLNPLVLFGHFDQKTIIYRNGMKKCWHFKKYILDMTWKG